MFVCWLERITNAEIHKMTLINNGKVKKKISVFSFIEFCFLNTYDDMTNFQRNFSTVEVEIEGNTIYHKTEYKERRNYIPERARERILDLAATQLEDGGAYHQYQPFTKKGNNEIGGNL